MQTKLEPPTVGSPALIPCEMTAMSNCRDVKGLMRDPSVEQELDYVPFPQCTPPEQWLVHCCQTWCACNCFQGSYPTCFDQEPVVWRSQGVGQETKPLFVSIKKQNRSRNKTVQETKPCPALPRIFLEFFFQALPTRLCHRICDRVVQNAQPCHRQTPHSSFFSSGCPWPKATVKPLCEIQVPKLRFHILKITS